VEEKPKKEPREIRQKKIKSSTEIEGGRQPLPDVTQAGRSSGIASAWHSRTMPAGHKPKNSITPNQKLDQLNRTGVKWIVSPHALTQKEPKGKGEEED